MTNCPRIIVSVPHYIILGIINIICRKTLSQKKLGHPTELVADGNSSSIIKAIINLGVKKKKKKSDHVCNLVLHIRDVLQHSAAFSETLIIWFKYGYWQETSGPAEDPMDYQYLVLISSVNVFGKMKPESGNEDPFERSKSLSHPHTDLAVYSTNMASLFYSFKCDTSVFHLFAICILLKVTGGNKF